MAKTTIREVNDKAWINNTFLAPYCGYLAKLIEYKNGRIDLHINGSLISHVEGVFKSEYNGWKYTVKKLLGQPLKTT